MNNIIVLIILILILIVIFLITLIMISKSKIEDVLTSIEISNDDINSSLKQKYGLYKEIINYIKNNISIKEDAFKDFDDIKIKDISKQELSEVLDKITFEINEYVDNYNDSLKKKDFLELKRKLYNIQLNFEALVDYYNNKLVIYNDLKNKGITSIATKLFDFSEFAKLNIDKKEISRLINLN